jgi:hypothetical protein
MLLVVDTVYQWSLTYGVTWVHIEFHVKQQSITHSRLGSGVWTINQWSIMSIHWPCYCTVCVYVVVPFFVCDDMWSFWVETNPCAGFVYHLLISVMPIDISK